MPRGVDEGGFAGSRDTGDGRRGASRRHGGRIPSRDLLGQVAVIGGSSLSITVMAPGQQDAVAAEDSLNVLPGRQASAAWTLPAGNCTGGGAWDWRPQAALGISMSADNTFWAHNGMTLPGPKTSMAPARFRSS